MRPLPLASSLLFLSAGLLPAQVSQQESGNLPSEWVSALQWRSIGPAAMSGRIVAFSVVAEQPRTYWVGTGAGGLLKTTNGGSTFAHQFTHEGSYAIGDVCHAPSNPDIVWVGTGEQNPIRSLSYGDGVYKSIDGGETWQHMGLEKSFMIGRIAIHPSDPNIVYVGAQGRLYGPNEERGLYKTSDGGESWEKILHIDDETGVIDVKMHPEDPDTLLVVSYQRMRDNYDGGRLPMDAGPGAGIWKTTDGGKNFNRITAGLPDNLTRSGVSYCYSNPDVVYAIIGQTRLRQGRGGAARGERQGQRAAGARGQRAAGARGRGGRAQGGQRAGRGRGQARTGVQGDSKVGLYRSEDGGDSWKLVNNQLGASWDFYFYGKIYADPVDPQRVYFLNVRSQVSEDGGHSFRPFTGGGVHSDSHALYIDRKNPEHLLLGNDGGVYESWDRSVTWDHLNKNALGTFYHVAVDERPIYWVYGGLQDNGTWGGPNRTRDRGPVNADWVRLGGGDGFVVFAHPDDPDLVFYESQNGNMSRRHLKTGESTRIRPEQGDGPRPRFNWKTPMLLSHHDSKVFYCAGNLLYRSENLGDDLVEISPELTFAEKGAATAIGEDRFDAEVLYAGCEDGALWVTRDGGENWQEISSRLEGMPGPRWVASIETSRYKAGRVYASFDAHRSDDDNPYVFVSEDFGETWANITANLPWGSTRTLREDVVNEDLLYVGHEFGVFASLDRGASWTRINNNLPTVSTHEIAVHPTAGEIVVGTHGRSFWILDVSALRQMTVESAGEAVALYTPSPYQRLSSVPSRGQVGMHGFVGQNPPAGAAIYYSLASDAAEVELAILDASGEKIRDVQLSEGNKAGLHRVVWDGRANPPPPGQGRGGRAGGQRGGRGRRGGRGARSGPPVELGTYTVQLRVDGQEELTEVQILPDPGR